MSINSSDVPEFKIKELTGQRRTVILTERGLPFRPLSMSGTQRVEVTTPPGSPDGISSITGPTEDDTTIHGKWSDKFLGATNAITNNSFQVTNVIAAVRLFDDIRISGQLLEVSWGPILRTGHISKFDHTWENVHDVEWSVAFKWVSRGRISYTVQPSLDMSGISGGIGTLLDKLKSLLAGLAVNPFSDEMDDLFALAQKIASLHDSIDAISTNFLDVASSPFTIVNNMRHALNGIIGACVDVVDKVDATFGSATGLYLSKEMRDASTSQGVIDSLLGNTIPTSLGGSADASANADAAALDTADARSLAIVVQTDAADIKTVARDMRNLAIEAQKQITDPESDILGVYIARQGDNLRDVSNAFYATPKQWRSLMVYNQLGSAELEVGDKIVVPRLSLDDGGLT